ncbi:uncharacterized protein LOC111344710 isoform X1 [Stylophora pistillata]|uniref:uncharacterized protein LOC111344710 isoform X1 n=1 Tax=Stylophora pistillata TaxID=50429 RepID=UPI000C0435AA|nr:uncharacterized protein LOC111344710 isoform X1 [Stylophora pistillata]
MNKSLHPIIIFFWGNILFLRAQCRGTHGILNDSKLSEHKELCFRRCDFSFQADDRGISSNEIVGRRSCYVKCLREDGDAKSVKSERRVFVDDQKTSLFNRIRRNANNTTNKQSTGVKNEGLECLLGMRNASNKTDAKNADGIRIVFREREDTGRYQGTVTWKPLQNESDGYKIIAVYNLGKAEVSVECEVVAKTVMLYNFTNSSNGIMNGSRVDVMVVSYPHFENLTKLLKDSQTHCKVPAVNGCYKRDITTMSPTGLQSSSTARGPAKTEPPYPRENGNRTTMILVAVFVTSCVSFVALVLAFGYYRRHKKHKSTKLANPLTELKFEFDAFIIYSSKDSEWVVKTLLPTLEEKHGLKCCVHYRDFTLGIPIRKNMVDSVYKCKKTVAVVSTNFFNSNYCGSELDYALHRLMEKNDNSLVVVKLDDVDRNKLPKELQNRSYIDYPKSIEKETWEKKLIKCLKVNS